MRTISFNIDIDPLISYFSIHGIDHGTIENDPVYSCGIKRFLDLLEKHSIKGTFFITAGKLGENEENILKEIVAKGHEVGNHSLSHDYRLTLLSDEEIFEDIRKNHEFIKEKTGYVCKGFRSPGYNSSPAIISALKKMNYSYDSSLFPSFSYYLLKWILIKIKSMRGHESRSIIYSFRDSFGFDVPEFIGKKVTDVKKTGMLAELPVTTLFPPLGIPLIGTSVICFPEWILNLLMKISAKRPFINIEAHGIDLCEISDSTHFEPLKNIQPDLKYSLSHKLHRFESLISFYTEKGYEFKTLSRIADLKNDGFSFEK